MLLAVILVSLDAYSFILLLTLLFYTWALPLLLKSISSPTSLLYGGVHAQELSHSKQDNYGMFRINTLTLVCVKVPVEYNVIFSCAY